MKTAAALAALGLILIAIAFKFYQGAHSENEMTHLCVGIGVCALNTSDEKDVGDPNEPITLEIK